MDKTTWDMRTCSRGDKDAVMSSMLLARFLGRASARLNAFLTGFWHSSSFSPTEREKLNKWISVLVYSTDSHQVNNDIEQRTESLFSVLQSNEFVF